MNGRPTTCRRQSGEPTGFFVKDGEVKTWPGRICQPTFSPLWIRRKVVIFADHVVGRVAPAFDVVEDHLVGRSPVAGVDELLAAEFFAEIAGDFAVEVVLQPAHELGLVGQAGLAALAIAFLVPRVLRQFPDDEHAGPAGGKIIVLMLVAPPGRLRFLERPILLYDPIAVELPQVEQSLAFDALHRPEEHAVLVLDQDDRYGRVLGQRHACIRIRFGIDPPQPGLVALLERGIEEQQRGAVAVSRVGHAPALLGMGLHGPVGIDHRVDAGRLHCRHEAVDLIQFLLIDVGHLRSRPLRLDGPVQPDDVHASLGKEPGVVLQKPLILFLVGDPLRIVRTAPEANRLAVAADERVAVLAEADEAMLTGSLFVQAAQIEQGVRRELVRSRAGRARCLLLSAKPGPWAARRACAGSWAETGR